MSKINKRRSVAILGGGVAGMSAAHELAERGFRVTVYEARQTPGGKARSIFVPGTGRAGRRGLPGEHGFRFFPSFYRHLPDTMKRIPFGANPRGVFDNLVGTDRTRIMRTDGNWFDMVSHFPVSLDDLRTMAPSAWCAKMGIPPADTKEFLRRTLLFLTACSERRLAEYENITYWDYLDCDRRHPNFQKYFGEVAVQALVAMQPRLASARTTVTIGLQLWLEHTKPGTRVARVLNGPTHDVWLGPWLAYLKQRGVDYREGARVASLRCNGARISGVMLADGTEVHADYYVAALPAERMAELVDAPLLAADPALGGIARLTTAWMNGIQFFLRREVPLAPGHAILVDAPWALTCVSQRQWWASGALAGFGDGAAEGVLSLCISDWNKPGTFVRKPARACSRDEIRHEVWEQIKAHAAAAGQGRLSDDDVLHWYLADSIEHRPDGSVVNHEPLLINTVGSWSNRPEARTRIANLMLAADYVRTYTDIATMESANEAARRAVNAILADAEVDARPCDVWPLEEPEVFAPQRKLDEFRFRRGLPHAMTSLLGEAPTPLRAPSTGGTRLGSGEEEDKLCGGAVTHLGEKLLRRVGLSFEPARCPAARGTPCTTVRRARSAAPQDRVELSPLARHRDDKAAFAPSATAQGRPIRVSSPRKGLFLPASASTGNGGRPRTRLVASKSRARSCLVWGRVGLSPSRARPPEGAAAPSSSADAPPCAARCRPASSPPRPGGGPC